MDDSVIRTAGDLWIYAWLLRGGVDFFGGKYLELCEIGYIFVGQIVILLFLLTSP